MAATTPERKTELTGQGQSPRTTILILLVLFVAPVVIAWFMANTHTFKPPGSELTNHGQLLQPPVDVRQHTGLQALANLPLQPSEWAMVFFSAEPCAADCYSALETLQAVRLLLGHDATRLYVALASDADAAAPPGPLLRTTTNPSLSLQAMIGERTGKSPKSGILFLDWRGQLVMFFAETGSPEGIKSDIKKLLKGSRIR